MARRKTHREVQKEKEEKLKKQFGVKETNPVSTVLVGKNEDKLDILQQENYLRNLIKETIEGRESACVRLIKCECLF